LTATGFSIYGLSTDSPKANTTFKAKQNLPYYLLCDPSASLIGAIGLKKAPKGTTRGVFVVNKSGKVLAGEAGGPAATVAVVKNLVEAAPKFEDTKTAPPAPTPSKVDVEKAEVAADVANTAAMLDGESQKV
jgi:peroxiredoxin Q/BCP